MNGTKDRVEVVGTVMGTVMAIRWPFEICVEFEGGWWLVLVNGLSRLLAVVWVLWWFWCGADCQPTC